MSENQLTVQDAFLAELTTRRAPVTVYLTSGVQLNGTLTSFDREALLLNHGTHTQLIYKYMIATVVPKTALGIPNRPTKTTSEADLDDDNDWDSGN